MNKVNTEMYKLTKKIVFTFIICPLLTGCRPDKSSIKPETKYITGYQDTAELLFRKSYIDSIVRTTDEVFLYNSFLDTIIHEKGIFTYLHINYPLYTNEELVSDLKKAIELEEQGQYSESKSMYQAVVLRYDELINSVYRGDSNGYWCTMINSSLICSFAYEKLERFDKALNVLRPHIANPETYGSKIIQRFFELCVSKYGRDRVEKELLKAPRTLAYIDSTYYKFWSVEIFDAHLDLNIYDKLTPSLSDVENLIEEKGWYEFIN